MLTHVALQSQLIHLRCMMAWVMGRGWVGRESWVVGLRSPMYTLHCTYTFMLLTTAVLSAISFKRVHWVTLKGLCQRCYINILSVVHIILLLIFLSTTGFVLIMCWNLLQSVIFQNILLSKISRRHDVHFGSINSGSNKLFTLKLKSKKRTSIFGLCIDDYSCTNFHIFKNAAQRWTNYLYFSSW